MNLEDLRNKKLLLFGKSRAFSNNELQMQLSSHAIELVDTYEEDVEYIVDGAMMTPAQTMQSEALYEKKAAHFLNIELLENMLSDSIDGDVLMMSLKLSNDKKRLIEFLKNTKIKDSLYLRLLGIYDWGDDDFYENDENRDVSASLIRRFYKNIERNHNIEFSKLGLMHLVVQCSDPEVLESVAKLKPLRKSFDKSEKDHGFKILSSLATNALSPSSVLKYLIKESNRYIRTLIAMRNDLDEEIQKMLYESGDEKVLEALSFCKNLSDELFDIFIENKKYASNMAKYIKLDKRKYALLKEEHISALAKNETLEESMQKDVIDSCVAHTSPHLAKNKNISRSSIVELLARGDEEVDFEIYSNPATPQDILSKGFKNYKNYFALACNENTPESILEEIYKEASHEIKMALAENISTPTDILYQLYLDAKYAKYVKENPSFGEHIQKENIGWL